MAECEEGTVWVGRSLVCRSPAPRVQQGHRDEGCQEGCTGGMQSHWNSLKSTGVGVGKAERHWEHPGQIGSPQAMPREGQGRAAGADCSGKGTGNTGAPLCSQGWGKRGWGCPGELSAIPEPPPLPDAGRGAPPPPPVGGFTGFRGNESGAELGASVTEVPGQAGTGRGRCRCRVPRCCRRPAPGEWPRGAAPAPPARGSRAGPGLPLSAGCERWHGAPGARRERGSPLARGGRRPRQRDRDRGAPSGAAPPARCDRHRDRHRDRPAAGPARPEPRSGEQGTPRCAGRFRVLLPAEAAPVRCGECGAVCAERSGRCRAERGARSGAGGAVQRVHCVRSDAVGAVPPPCRAARGPGVPNSLKSTAARG